MGQSMSVNITNTSGIIFGDIFINNKEFFVDIFEQYYLQNQQELNVVINELNRVLTQYTTQSVTKAMAEEFSAAWHNFQQTVLLNQQDLQLIVAYRGHRGKDARFSQILKQSDVEGSVNGRYGINSGNALITESMSALKAAEVEKFLQSHLNGFLNQLETLISDDESVKLYEYHKQFLHEQFLQSGPPSIRGLRWRVPFYGPSAGHYFAGQGLGQAYDAFMNHIANHNRQVYDYLVKGGLTEPPMTIHKKGSVFREEGGAEAYSSFPQLLNESKNHVGWYTGGDIVIVDPKTMGVVYNIQLKTTTEKKTSVFMERISAIRTFIQALVKMTPRQKGEKVFDFLKTSISNKADFNNLPQETINDIVKQELQAKIKMPLF